ncbi:MAG TPA: M15 family metallopeptidase [Polyangiaceae bacterium]|nr:M15 family metallopeptidase [Polyangiaceae bacterium]
MRSALSVVALAVVASGAACAASAPTPLTASSPSPSPASAATAASSSSPAGTSAPASSPSAGEAIASTIAPPAVEPKTPEVSESPSPGSACTEQAPQDFLIRGNFLKDPKGNERAIQYRTDQYGYFKGYGHPAAGAQPPSAQVVSTTFMGLPVRMHRKVVPALACVEKEIVRACADHPYTPQALAGIRFRNTYRGGEVTNHAYGIAIDVDPARNTCCGCVPPWNDAPACKRPGKSEYDHMDMPECWVHAFERFGFYWLGHDVLRDTMHFEFLGDPDKIGAPAIAAPAASTPPNAAR